MLLDPGEAFRELAVQRAAITGIVGAGENARIGIRLQGIGPAIRYAPAGGRVGYPEEGEPRLQVECWGASGEPDDGTASRLARIVADEAPTMRGEVTDGWVAGCVVDGHPFASNDPDTDRPRWIVPLQMFCYGA